MRWLALTVVLLVAERTAAATPCSRDAVGAELRALGGPALGELGDRVRIEIRGLAGSITHELTSGEVIGPRVVRSRTCKELAKSLALVIVMSLRADEPLEPASVTRDAVIVPPTLELSTEPSMGIEARDAIAARTTTRQLALSVGAAGDVARHSALVVGGRWRHGRMSVALELQLRSPLTIDVDAGGAVAITQVGLAAVPCAHLRALALCGLATGALIGGEGRQLADAAHVRRAAAALGGRVELAVPLGNRLSLRLHFDALQALTETRFLVDEMAVWTSESRELWLGAGVVAHFP